MCRDVKSCSPFVAHFGLFGCAPLRVNDFMNHSENPISKLKKTSKQGCFLTFWEADNLGIHFHLKAAVWSFTLLQLKMTHLLMHCVENMSSALKKWLSAWRWTPVCEMWIFLKNGIINCCDASFWTIHLRWRLSGTCGEFLHLAAAKNRIFNF